MRKTILTAVLAGPLPVCLASAQGQEPTGPRQMVVEISSNREAIALARALISRGRMDEARAVVGGWQPDHPDHGIRVRFVEGLIAASEGRHGEAVDMYRAILAERPALDSVRIELAKSLFLQEDDDAARAQAERLIAAGVDDRIGGSLSTMLRVLDGRRPIRFRGYGSLLPSSNINGGTDNETVPLGGTELTIDEEAKRKSGLGVLLGGDVLFRQTFTPTTAFVGSLGGSGRFYPEIDRTLVSVDASAGIERHFGRARVLVSAVAGSGMTDFSEDLRYGGGRAELSVNLSQNWRVLGSATLRYEDDRKADANSGWWGGITLHADRMLTASRFVRLIAGYSGARKEADRYSYDEVLAGAGVYNEFGYGITLYAQATLAGRQYDGDYPGLGKPRRDTRVTAQIVATKRDLSFAGFAPQLSYTFERNFSNAAFNDTTRHDVELRWTKDF